MAQDARLVDGTARPGGGRPRSRAARLRPDEDEGLSGVYSLKFVEVVFCELRFADAMGSSPGMNSTNFAFWGFSEVHLQRYAQP